MKNGIPVAGKISAGRAGRQGSKGRAIIVPAPPRYRIGYAEPSEWLGSWRARYGRGLRVLPEVATRTNMTYGLAGNRRPLPANGLPRRAVVHIRRSERGTWRCGPGGGDSSLPLDRTYRSSHEPVLRCLVVRGDEHHLPFRDRKSV